MLIKNVWPSLDLTVGAVKRSWNPAQFLWDSPEWIRAPRCSNADTEIP